MATQINTPNRLTMLLVTVLSVRVSRCQKLQMTIMTA